MEISLPQNKHTTTGYSNVSWYTLYGVWVVFNGIKIYIYIQDVLLGNGNSTALNAMESMEIAGGGVGLDMPTYCSPSHVCSKHDTIPEDPFLAETHYAEVIPYIDWCHMISHDVQYDDFEDDDECSDPEDSQVGSMPTMTSLWHHNYCRMILKLWWDALRMHWTFHLIQVLYLWLAILSC